MMRQTHNLISEETVNEFHRLLRMRTRPKIFLAETFSEAEVFFNQYRDNILGILSDVGFPLTPKGEIEPDAGSIFIKKAKEFNKFLPCLLMSSQNENENKAQLLQSSFIYKHSPKALFQLRKFFSDSLGFGDFVFRFPNGTRVATAKKLEELKLKLQDVPDECLVYHASNNHFSNWLMARGEFEIAYSIRPKRIADFINTRHLRQFLINTIDEIKFGFQSGTIADFNPDDFGQYDEFARFGQGSLGGKGRGLAFLQNLISRSHFLKKKYTDIQIKIPLTFVICTEEFDKFIDINLLHSTLHPKLSDDQIINIFLESKIQSKLEFALISLIKKLTSPIAVRSSSLLEDSLYKPFAGVYKTFMIPNNEDSDEDRLNKLEKAIKLIYASMFLALPRFYLENITTLIEQEKMAIVIQEIVGSRHYNHYYPDISGVAQSFNYYPFGDISPDDGHIVLGLGFGKYIVDGEQGFNFCPKYPQVIPQMANIRQFLKTSQSFFYSLNMDPKVELTYEERSTLLKNGLDIAERDGILFKIGSVYDRDSDVIRDCISTEGPRVITFAGILKYNIFPLPDILQDLLYMGKKAFGSPVEIEFAISLEENTSEPKKIPSFYLLQIKPFATGLIDSLKASEFDFTTESSIIYSAHCLGNGISNLSDIVFVKNESFDRMKTHDIANEIRQFNSELQEQKRPFILIGPGRWGSNDPFLGIPVKWNEISGAEVIVEINLLAIEPSFGSHFFANIIGLNIPYFTISNHDHISKPNPDPNKVDGIKWDIINSLPLVKETQYLKHVRTDQLEIIVDGRTRRGIIKFASKTPQNANFDLE